MLQVFWFQIPFGYAMIGLGLFLLGLYLGYKITIITVKVMQGNNNGGHH